ncbi:MAG: hypothetical protein IPQ24_12540 [Anaeromyxobacter sp.]|nr:hypothetical protein [Anaeromyxobacter sp.]
MTSESKKAHEREVFLEFSVAAGLGVAPDSVQSPDEPKPDIMCGLDGVTTYFELGRILDSAFVEQRITAMRVAPAQVPLDITRVRLPERTMLEQKLGKSYEVDGAPFELLLYYDFEDANPRTASIAAEPIEGLVRHVWRPLLEVHPRVFRRVWVYERFRRVVLWRSEA